VLKVTKEVQELRVQELGQQLEVELPPDEVQALGPHQ